MYTEEGLAPAAFHARALDLDLMMRIELYHLGQILTSFCVISHNMIKSCTTCSKYVLGITPSYDHPKFDLFNCKINCYSRICLLIMISCGTYRELARLQRLISCTFEDYFLRASI